LIKHIIKRREGFKHDEAEIDTDRFKEKYELKKKRGKLYNKVLFQNRDRIPLQ